MTSHSYVTDDVKFQGFLEKQGRLTGPLMVKKYWCVLDEHRLSYYKNSNKVCLESLSSHLLSCYKSWTFISR